MLRQHKLRLNAKKCAFGVGADTFLGYLITGRGIEVNPDQIKAMVSKTSEQSQGGANVNWYVSRP